MNITLNHKVAFSRIAFPSPPPYKSVNPFYHLRTFTEDENELKRLVEEFDEKDVDRNPIYKDKDDENRTFFKFFSRDVPVVTLLKADKEVVLTLDAEIPQFTSVNISYSLYHFISQDGKRVLRADLFKVQITVFFLTSKEHEKTSKEHEKVRQETKDLERVNISTLI